MSLVLGLETFQIEISIEFCQADIVEMIYVEMPKDFGDPKGCDMVVTLKNLNRVQNKLLDHGTSSKNNS